jgi:hypothetical protein
MSSVNKLEIINFKSKPKNNFFAPEWNYYLFESKIDKIDFNNLSNFLLNKKEEILNLPYTFKNNKITDGYTGLGKNSTTIRFNRYNVFNWKNENILLLKETIINFHNKIIDYFKLPSVNKLYIQSWVNIMKKGEKIQPHIHGVTPDTYLGGHVCIQCDNTSTYYINPINQINEPEIFSSKNEIGKITLFQNNIPHFTDLHNSDDERITIAFDLSLKKLYKNYIRII